MATPNDKKKGLPPAAKMGISSAVTGGILGSLPIFKRGTTRGVVLKSAGIGAAAGGGLGAASALIGSKVLGDPKPNEGGAYTKRGAVGGAIGGAAAGGLGVLALRKVGRRLPFVGSPARMLVNASKKDGSFSRLAMSLRKASLPAAMAGGAAVGGAWGAFQSADEGQQLDTMASIARDKKRATRQLADSRKVISFKTGMPEERWLNQGLTGRVSTDRLKKKIDDTEKVARDANMARSMVAGSLVGAAAKVPGAKLVRRAAFGAAGGGLLSIAVRSGTAGTRDIYGERSHDAKKIDRLPQKALLVGAGYLGYRRLRSGLKAKAAGGKFFFARPGKRLIYFDGVRASRDADDLRAQRRQLALYGGAVAGVAGLGIMLRGGGGAMQGAVKSLGPKAGGRSTLDRLATANSLRASRGYGNLRPMTSYQKKRFAKLPPETQKLAGRGDALARSADLSPGERQAARHTFGKFRAKHNFSRPVRPIYFGGRQQLRDDNNRFVDPLGVAAGLQQASIRNGDGSFSPVDIPVSHAQVLRSAYRRGKEIKRTGVRAGGLARDVGDVVTGRARRRDELGRPKRREWEKRWFKDAAVSAGVGASLLGGAAYLRRNPKARAKLVNRVTKVKAAVNRKVPDFFPTRQFTRGGSARVIYFDQWAELNGWDVRDPRGRSARVFAPGSRARTRREKEWYEKASAQRKLLGGLAIGGTLAGGVGGVLLAGAGKGALAKGARRASRRPSVVSRVNRATPGVVVPSSAPGVRKTSTRSGKIHFPQGMRRA